MLRVTREFAFLCAFGSIYLACGGPGNGEPGEQQQGQPAITVSDDTVAESPCPQDPATIDVSQTEYESLRRLMKEILADSTGVIDDIDSQIRSLADEAPENPIEIEIGVCAREEFIDGYVEDHSGPDTTDEEKARLREHAGRQFDRLGGITYIHDGKIRIKIFCKSGLAHNPGNAADIERLRELIIHELVHAKLYSLELVGVSGDDLPFSDHGEPPDPDGDDAEFYQEVARLLELLESTFPPAICLQSEERECENDCPGGICCLDETPPEGHIPCEILCEQGYPWCP